MNDRTIARLLLLAHRHLTVRRAPLVALAFITLVLATMYAGAFRDDLGIFRGEVAGDDNTFHYAETARIAEAVSQGDWDWWNPSANGGFASGYYYQLIPAAVPGILAGVFGDPLFWFQLGIFLPLVLVPAACYRALRVLDVDVWGALGGAVAAGFAVGGSKWGQDGVLLVGLYTQGWAMCVYPLAFAYGCRWMAHGSNLGNAVGWGLFAGLCHPIVGVALAPALYVVSLALMPSSLSAERAPLRLLLLGVLLLLGSIPAWLPVLVYYDGFGGFPHRVADEVGPGFRELGRWLEWWHQQGDKSGYLLDSQRELGDYRLPIMTALLAPALIYAVVAAALRRPGRLTLLWCSALVLAFILGIGRSLPKTQDDLFPAVRVMAPLQLTLALAVGGAVGSGLAWAVRALDRVDLGEIAQAVVGAVVGLLVIVYAVPAIGVLGGRARVSTDWQEIHRDELAALMPAIRAAAPGRIQNRGGVTKEGAPGVENHWFMLLPYIDGGKPALVAYGGASLQSSPNFVYLYSLPVAGRAAWIYDAPLVLARKDSPWLGGHVLATTEHFELRELPTPGFISGVEVVGQLPPGRNEMRAAVLRWQASDDALSGRVRVHAGSGGVGPPPQGEARDVHRDGSQIRAQLEVRAPTTFVVRESWHPHWRATLDGRSVPIRRVTPDFMAIDAPPGAHRLELRFERAAWLWLSYLLIPAAIALGWWISRRHTPREGAA